MPRCAPVDRASHALPLVSLALLTLTRAACRSCEQLCGEAEAHLAKAAYEPALDCALQASKLDEKRCEHSCLPARLTH